MARSDQWRLPRFGRRRLAVGALSGFALVVTAWPARAQEDASSGCSSRPPLSFVCGTQHPEDLAPVPGTPWLIVSGFTEGAGLKLINTRAKSGKKCDEPACGGVRRVIAGKADDMHCHRGYVVAAVDPSTLDFHTLAYSGPNPDFNGVSTGVILDGILWLGSYQADRVAFRPTP